MFYALKLPAWADHPVTRYSLGITGEETFSRRRGLRPMIVLGLVVGALLVPAWYGLEYVYYRAAIWNYPAWGLVPLGVLFSPVVAALIAGFAIAWFGAQRARRDFMFRNMAMGTVGKKEFFDAYIVGLAAQALVLVTFLFQAVALLMLFDERIFHAEISYLFLVTILIVNAFCAGALVLDFALLLALREVLHGRGTAVALMVRMPLALLEVLATLIAGVGIGGLAWLAWRVDRIERQIAPKIFDIIGAEADQEE